MHVFHLSSEKHFLLFCGESSTKATSEVSDLLDDVKNNFLWARVSPKSHRFLCPNTTRAGQLAKTDLLVLLWPEGRTVLHIDCTNTLSELVNGYNLNHLKLSGLHS